MTIEVQIAYPGLPATAISFTVSNNATWDVPFRWKSGDTAVAIIGDLFMQIRDGKGGMFDFSTANNRLEITDREAGEWHVNVPLSQTSGVTAGAWTYDVLDKASGNDQRVWKRQQGTVTVEDGVTKLSST